MTWHLNSRQVEQGALFYNFSIDAHVPVGDDILPRFHPHPKWLVTDEQQLADAFWQMHGAVLRINEILSRKPAGQG